MLTEFKLILSNFLDYKTKHSYLNYQIFPTIINRSDSEFLLGFHGEGNGHREKKYKYLDLEIYM